MPNSEEQPMINAASQAQQNQTATTDKSKNGFALEDAMRMIEPKPSAHLAHAGSAFAFFAIALLLMILAIYLGTTMNFGGTAIATIFSLLLFSVSQGLVRVEYNAQSSTDYRIW